MTVRQALLVLAGVAVPGVAWLVGHRVPVVRPGPAHVSTAPSVPTRPGLPEGALFVYVRIPAAVEPLERGERFEDPLHAVLEEAGVGEVSGGGTGLGPPGSDGKRPIAYCGIDVELSDAQRGLPLLRRTLLDLAVPEGTTLEYAVEGREHSELVHQGTEPQPTRPAQAAESLR